ncbi:MAG TPA: PAS domain S-box protein [Candidatus Kapabacteria bacterium]|nr:PAS domain S-box protein [Candidatus Kapabacteria bacterium]
MIKEKILAFFRWLLKPSISTGERIQFKKARFFSLLLLTFIVISFFYMLGRLMTGNGTVDIRYLSIAFFVLLAVLIMALTVMYRISLEESQRRAELIEKEERYRLLIENICEAIFTTDLSGYLTYVSPPAERMSKYKMEELVGRHFSSFIHPDDLAEVKKTIKKLYTGISETVEFRFIDKDNKLLCVRVSGRLIKKNGKPIAITGLVTDITEKKKMEDQLHQAQKMESVGRLAGAIAHDFNNFITAIMGYCRMLAADIPGDQPAGGFIKGIQTAAERAASLTERLLVFSRKQPTEPRALNINEQVLSLESILQSLIGENITLATSLAAGIHAVKMDPVQLEQVIMNLVVNAIDAMPQKGTLRIETANVELNEEYCRRYTDIIPGNYVMILVADTGCGMSEETKEFLFEPFFTTKSPGEGTGLGLATVYGIVKQNKGHIWFESELEKGTTFKIYFPAITAAVEDVIVEPKSAPVEVDMAEGRKETLLVVEDEADLRDVIINILQGYGYRTHDAGTGEEALELCSRLNEGKIDMLITDVVMPGMNGKELADEMANLFPDVKVLFISGYTGKRIVTHDILSRGLSFPAKPFSPMELLQKIRLILDSKN